MNLSVTSRKPYAPPVEFVERKGTGHPDTICDFMAEELARKLAREYLANTGAVRHFNVDKALLAAGSVDVGFGGGTHLTKSRLILVGKADFSREWAPDPAALADEFHKILMGVLPDADEDAFAVEVWLSQSAADLAVVNQGDVPLSNDTSFAAVSLPRSPLEEAVYRVEVHLNSDEFRNDVPVGRDIKVMGARFDTEARLTVAVPVLAGRVQSRAEYDEVIDTVRAAALTGARQVLDDQVEVAVNQADSANSAYLTMSGTSAEAGDDGQVGRGNRFGGLITPYRPMSLEAAAGKNPAAHVGKTYHAVGHDIATRLIAEGVGETTIRLLSSIGQPVTEPQAAHVQVPGEPDETLVEQVVNEAFADWDGVRDRLIDGHYDLF
ncbi:MAG: S-adenosylmethionine synthase [Acidimicrobiia bacterium]|nr:S-adenosylmethionine synthase [Acidimicrobiia bacterium]